MYREQILLSVLHDTKTADRMAAEARLLKDAAHKYMVDKADTFGFRWQTNAYAVLSGVATKAQDVSIWQLVLSHVGTSKYCAYVILPYYIVYVVTAMADMNHRRVALNWIRQYWSGMVNEGATSFWEGYNPTWFRGFQYRQNLQADNASGYHVSLAHRWSSGVTPWLMTQILRIRPTAGGFAKIHIRPDLLGLKWAKGGEPTPHGVLHVSIQKTAYDDYVTTTTLPAEEIAPVSVPVSTPKEVFVVNRRRVTSTASATDTRRVVTLRSRGAYVVTKQ